MELYMVVYVSVPSCMAQAGERSLLECECPQSLSGQLPKSKPLSGESLFLKETNETEAKTL